MNCFEKFFQKFWFDYGGIRITFYVFFGPIKLISEQNFQFLTRTVSWENQSLNFTQMPTSTVKKIFFSFSTIKEFLLWSICLL